MKDDPKQKKSRQSRSKVNVMLIVFFDIRRLVHHEFIQREQAINKEYYLTALKRLRDN